MLLRLRFRLPYLGQNSRRCFFLSVNRGSSSSCCSGGNARFAGFFIGYILQYVANKKAGKPGVSTATATATTSPVYRQEETTPTILPQVRQPEPQPQQHIQSYSGNVEIVELDRMRKMISEHMIRSQDTSAHVTSFTECDVTNMVHWRDKVKKQFEKQE